MQWKVRIQGRNRTEFNAIFFIIDRIDYCVEYIRSKCVALFRFDISRYSAGCFSCPFVPNSTFFSWRTANQLSEVQ